MKHEILLFDCRGLGFPLMLLRQTETGLGFFFKLLSVLEETLVNGKYERLIRIGGFLCMLQGAAVRVTGSLREWQMDSDALARNNPVGLFVLTDFS